MTILLPDTGRRRDLITYDVGTTFRLAWSAPVQAETATMGFVTVDNVRCLRDDYRGLVEVGREPISDRRYSPWKRWDLPFETASQNTDGTISLATANLDVYSWRPGKPPQRFWKIPAQAATVNKRSVNVRRVDENLVLVADYKQDKSSLWSLGETEPLWCSSLLEWFIRLGDRAIGEFSDRAQVLVCFDLATRVELWTLDLRSDVDAFDVVGIVDGVLWYHGKKAWLMIDPITGQKIREVPKNYRGLGTLEAPGIYYVSSAGYYWQYDLRNGAEEIVKREYPNGGEYPSRPWGLLASDGRYLVCDDRIGLWVIHTDEQHTREVVWRAPARIDRWTIAHGMVYAVDERQVMHCLGDAITPVKTYDPPPLVPEIRTFEADPEPPLSALWQSRETLPIANPKRDSQGRLVAGTLTTDTVIDGLPCRGGERVTFWIPDGWLENATLSREVDLADFTLPAGSKFMTWDCGSIFHSVFPALDRVIHGVRIPAGSEVLLDEQTGRTVRMLFLGGDLQLEARDEHGRLQHRRLAKGDALYWQRGGWWFDMPEDS